MPIPQPLAPAQLRAAIFVRLGVAIETSSHHRGIVLGQIQGLLYALTGQYTSLASTSFSGDILDLAGIPYTRQGETIQVSDEWLKNHGFSPDDKGGYSDRHPRFSEPW